jgi:hypothetical protein
MALKRYYPSKDTSIANYDKVYYDNKVQITASNMGASEILNMYQYSFTRVSMSMSVTGPDSGTFVPVLDESGSLVIETVLARSNVLIDFDVVVLPSTASSIFLKMFDAQHAETLPGGYRAVVQDLDVDWTEGTGQDLDYYKDLGAANWVSATLNTEWAEPGAEQPTVGVSYSFNTGHEDLEVDLTALATGTLWPSRGYIVSVDTAYSASDLYIKKFHSRHTHFPKKRPYLEVRWNDSTAVTSSIDKFKCSVGVWSGSYLDLPKSGSSFITGSLSGAIETVSNVQLDPTGTLIFKMPNLKPEYETTEVPTLRVDITPKDWELAVVPSVSLKHALTNLYYRVVDDVSGEVLVPFGTGSVAYTKLSYDDNGNFFRFDMNNLAPGYVYSIDFWNSGSSTLSKSKEFKFRVR